MSEIAQLTAFFAGFFSIIGYFDHQWNVRVATHVHKWAARNGYGVKHCRRRYFFTGPYKFGFFAGRNRPIFDTTFVDLAGVEHRGWVRVGGLPRGFYNPVVEVQWAPAHD